MHCNACGAQQLTCSEYYILYFYCTRKTVGTLETTTFYHSIIWDLWMKLILIGWGRLLALVNGQTIDFVVDLPIGHVVFCLKTSFSSPCLFSGESCVRMHVHYMYLCRARNMPHRGHCTVYCTFTVTSGVLSLACTVHPLRYLWMYGKRTVATCLTTRDTVHKMWRTHCVRH